MIGSGDIEAARKRLQGWRSARPSCHVRAARGQGAVLQAGELAADRRLQAARRVQQDLLPLPRGARPRGRGPLQR